MIDSKFTQNYDIFENENKFLSNNRLIIIKKHNASSTKKQSTEFGF